MSKICHHNEKPSATSLFTKGQNLWRTNFKDAVDYLWRNNKPQKISMRVTTSQFEITRKNKGNKSSSRSLARFCRRKHKESTAHPSCSTCRQVYIMHNLVCNKSVSKAEWLWGREWTARRSRLSAFLSTSGRSTQTLARWRGSLRQF